MSASFDFSELYSLAYWLFDTRPATPSQCLLRSIANRAYYAAIILASEYTGVTTSQKDGHKKIIEAIERSEGPYIGNKLKSLRALRVNADYKTSNNISVSEINIKLNEVREVLFAIGKAPTNVKPYSRDYLDYSKFCSYSPTDEKGR